MRQRGLGITWCWELVYVEVAPWLAAVGVHGAGVWLPAPLVAAACVFVFGLFDWP